VVGPAPLLLFALAVLAVPFVRVVLQARGHHLHGTGGLQALTALRTATDLAVGVLAETTKRDDGCR
jgi:hypothetical protein